MKKRFKTLKIITNPNVQELLIFKRHYISLLQGSVRITRARFDRRVQLATSVREHTRGRARPTRHLGNRVVALSLMCAAHDWPLLQKGQLYKQMPQTSINNKLFSKMSYAFDRKLLSSNNFNKKRSYVLIKESVSWIWKGKLPERRPRSNRTRMPSKKLPASNSHLEFLLKCSLFRWINSHFLL